MANKKFDSKIKEARILDGEMYTDKCTYCAYPIKEDGDLVRDTEGNPYHSDCYWNGCHKYQGD